MILGIGTDIVDVAQFERRIERGRLLRVFSEAELAYADEKPKRRMQTLAARWAAKEAFAKALGTGIRAEWNLDELEVVSRRAARKVLLPTWDELHVRRVGGAA